MIHCEFLKGMCSSVLDTQLSLNIFNERIKTVQKYSWLKGEERKITKCCPFLSHYLQGKVDILESAQLLRVTISLIYMLLELFF